MEGAMLWDIGDPFKDIIIILVIEDPSYISVLSQVSKSVYERIHNEEFWALLCKFHFGLTPTYSHESNLMNPNYHFYREILAGPYRPCALCRKYPITGVRYKCLNCVDVDLCEECENSGIHPLNHLVYKTFYPELKPKQIRARGKIPLPECSVCMEKPTRYMFHKCISLNENYFFCESCSSDKESTHALGSNSSRLWKIKCGVALNSIVSSERRGKNPRGAWCDIRYPDVCERMCGGINWKCTNCYGLDICQPCDKEIRRAVERGDEERLPSIRDHSHTSKCCVLKLYYISPDYGEWNLNLSLGSSSEDEEEENLKNFALL